MPLRNSWEFYENECFHGFSCSRNFLCGENILHIKCGMSYLVHLKLTGNCFHYFIITFLGFIITGVQKIIVPGASLKSSKEALRLARIYPGTVYCTAGMLPVCLK